MKTTITTLAAVAAIGTAGAQQLTTDLLNGGDLVDNGSFVYTAVDGSTGTAFLSVVTSNSNVSVASSGASNFTSVGGNNTGGDLPTSEIHTTTWTLTFDTNVDVLVDIFQVNQVNEAVTFTGSPIVTLASDHMLTGSTIQENNTAAPATASTLLDYGLINGGTGFTITQNSVENSVNGLASSFRVQVQGAVPEPSSALLLGLGGLGFLARRKRA